MRSLANYKDLDLWRATRELVNEVYLCSQHFPKDEIFGLVPQIRRAAVSSLSNIAEGCGRGSSNDLIRFLYIAQGSMYEVETQLIVARDQSYIVESDFNRLMEKVERCKKLVAGFIKYLNEKRTNA